MTGGWSSAADDAVVEEDEDDDEGGGGGGKVSSIAVDRILEDQLSEAVRDCA